MKAARGAATNDRDNRDAEPRREFADRFKRAPNRRIDVGIDFSAKVRADRINDDQSHIPEASNLPLEQHKIGAQVERAPALVPDTRDKAHAVTIGAGGHQARNDGIRGVVLGRKNDDATGRSAALAAWPLTTGGHGRSHRKRYLRLTKPGLARNERELAKRDAAGPQPRDRLDRNG